MKKRSLVLVTVDCLRADHVGFQGCSPPVTPYLDSLAKSSTVFSNAIVAGVPTYFSVPAILASRHPLGLGREVLGIAPGETTIATALQAQNYATAAFLAGNPYLSPRFGYHQGFDKFHDFLDSAPSEQSSPAQSPDDQRPSNFNRLIQAVSRRTAATAAAYDELYFWYCQWRTARGPLKVDGLRPYPAAETMVDQASSWLRGIGEQPFFLWIHLMDAHYPHYPPQEALAALGASEMTLARTRFVNAFWNRREIGSSRLKRYRAEIISLYDASVYWVDQQISRLVSCLEELKRWDETVFVLTADHGEEFLEHGGRYHSPTSPFEQLIHVPLLLWAPGLSRAVVERPFSLIHLAPTLMEAVGSEVPESFMGKSCWEQLSNGKDLKSEFAISESVGTGLNPLQISERMRPRVMAVRDREHKLIINFSNKTDLLYDLRNDPGEESPLPVRSFVEERARLLRLAHDHLHERSNEPRRKRNAELALRARTREIRQSLHRGATLRDEGRR
jgi:arylsulfatase A-like enzyme